MKLIEIAGRRLPRSSGGVDWSAERFLVLVTKDAMLAWRPGCMTWAGNYQPYEYTGGSLDVTYFNSSRFESIVDEGKLADHLKNQDVLKKIAKAMNLTVKELPNSFRPGCTYVEKSMMKKVEVHPLWKKPKKEGLKKEKISEETQSHRDFNRADVRIISLQVECPHCSKPQTTEGGTWSQTEKSHMSNGDHKCGDCGKDIYLPDIGPIFGRTFLHNRKSWWLP